MSLCFWEIGEAAELKQRLLAKTDWGDLLLRSGIILFSRKTTQLKETTQIIWSIFLAIQEQLCDQNLEEHRMCSDRFLMRVFPLHY